jgi:translation initiation factor IF-1
MATNSAVLSVSVSLMEGTIASFELALINKLKVRVRVRVGDRVWVRVKIGLELLILSS